MKFQIESVREAPAGFSDKTIALVSFTYEADQFAGPVNVQSYSPKTQKNYTVATIAGKDLVVRIIDAPLQRNKKGVWIFSSYIEVPEGIRRAVADEAFERFKDMQAGEVGTNPPQFPEKQPVKPWMGRGGAA